MANPNRAPLTRKDLILKRLCGVGFQINDNPKAKGNEPLYELSLFSQVNQYEAIIDRVAAEEQVDARLIRAIMYVETTHGYYDALLNWMGKNKSILPMNINVVYWGNVFGDRQALHDPYTNIKAGAQILFGIKANLPTGASIAQIATLYNNLNALHVSDYGLRVQAVYQSQPWLKR